MMKNRSTREDFRIDSLYFIFFHKNSFINYSRNP